MDPDDFPETPETESDCYSEPYPEPYEDDLEEFGRREVDEDREAGEFDDGDGEDYPETPEEEEEFARREFADPGGNSALRAAGPGNPHNLPCPTCGTPNMLTPKDRALGYQCDRCADRDEGGGF